MIDPGARSIIDSFKGEAIERPSDIIIPQRAGWKWVQEMKYVMLREYNT